MFNKNYYRIESLNKRQNLTHDEIAEKSEKIFQKIISLPQVNQAQKIYCYLSSKEKKEIDTNSFIAWAFKNNKEIYISGTDWKNKTLKIYHLAEFPIKKEKFVEKFDIYEPIAEHFNEYDGKDLDVILLPGSVGDINGTRYGYGAGFFDKLLCSLKKINKKFLTVFLLYECQFYRNIKLPSETFDFPVDIIITENEIVNVK